MSPELIFLTMLFFFLIAGALQLYTAFRLHCYLNKLKGLYEDNPKVIQMIVDMGGLDE